ncbi:MAG TPA: hypothetical protein VK709_00955 [Candidatus Saccharimonadales bacterium]|jgi:hypothetical protein|nr:hypothetical protein [Candidatus Saccharimonadales bacterium]
MANDAKHRRLFSSGRNPQFLVKMDANNGKVIQSFPILAGVDANVFEPATGMLFVSTREGMIHIYHEDSADKLSEVETAKTEYGAKTIQIDPKTHNLFLSTSDFDPPAAPSELQNDSAFHPESRMLANQFSKHFSRHPWPWNSSSRVTPEMSIRRHPVKGLTHARVF